MYALLDITSIGDLAYYSRIIQQKMLPIETTRDGQDICRADFRVSRGFEAFKGGP